jgi:hypothetical protein
VRLEQEHGKVELLCENGEAIKGAGTWGEGGDSANAAVDANLDGLVPWAHQQAVTSCAHKITRIAVRERARERVRHRSCLPRLLATSRSHMLASGAYDARVEFPKPSLNASAP